MKKNEKIMILILLIITIAVIFFAITRNKGNEELNEELAENEIVEQYVQNLEDGTKVNISNQLKQTKNVNGLEFSNIQLTQKNGETVLLADVVNKGTSATDMLSVDITLLDDKGAEIITVGGLIIPLEVGASTQFETSMTLDYANAYDFKITVQ